MNKLKCSMHMKNEYLSLMVLVFKFMRVVGEHQSMISTLKLGRQCWSWGGNSGVGAAALELCGPERMPATLKLEN